MGSIQCLLSSRSHNFLQPSRISMKHYTVISWGTLKHVCSFSGHQVKGQGHFGKKLLTKNFNITMCLVKTLYINNAIILVNYDVGPSL